MRFLMTTTATLLAIIIFAGSHRRWTSLDQICQREKWRMETKNKILLTLTLSPPCPIRWVFENSYGPPHSRATRTAREILRVSSEHANHRNSWIQSWTCSAGACLLRGMIATKLRAVANDTQKRSNFYLMCMLQCFRVLRQYFKVLCQSGAQRFQNGAQCKKKHVATST